MHWLLTLETDNDPIAACRLMNIFRRKGLRIITLVLAAQGEGYSLMALTEAPEADLEHLFNFLRRTEGVRTVTSYRRTASSDGSFVFIDADSRPAGIAGILAGFPGSNLLFASSGKYLLEIPAESRGRAVSPELGVPEFLTFARVRTTRGLARPQPVQAGAL